MHLFLPPFPGLPLIWNAFLDFWIDGWRLFMLFTLFTALLFAVFWLPLTSPYKQTAKQQLLS